VRREVLTWSDVDKLIDYLTPQIHGRFDSMIIVTRGGLVPGASLTRKNAMLCQSLSSSQRIISWMIVAF